MNVATAYRHFANKHELARAYLQQTLDRAVAMAEEASGVEDPMEGLAQFLGQAADLLAANRGFVDLLTNAYGAEWLKDQVHDMITGPIRHLVARGQQAGVVRPDVDGTDFAVILPMLASVSERQRGRLRSRAHPPLPGARPRRAAPGRHRAARPGADRRRGAGRLRVRGAPAPRAKGRAPVLGLRSPAVLAGRRGRGQGSRAPGGERGSDSTVASRSRSSPELRE